MKCHKQTTISTIIFSKIYILDDLRVTNKPRGFPLYKKDSRTDANACPFSLEEAMIPLALPLTVGPLCLVITTEIYTSSVSPVTSKQQAMLKSFEISLDRSMKT